MMHSSFLIQSSPVKPIKLSEQRERERERDGDVVI